MNIIHDEHFNWGIEDGKLKLSVKHKTFSKITDILECDEIEFQEYMVCLEKDVVMSLLAEYVENTLKQIQKGELNKELFREYLFTYEDFEFSLRSILECFIIGDKEVTESFDWVFEVCDFPNDYIFKQLMMVYGLLICKGYNVSKKNLLTPLTSKNLKLKKIRNKNLRLKTMYWEQNDYKLIMDKQIEFTIFLENLQMNGTYEQLCNKSLNLYYYNLFSRMVNLALFTEVICSTSNYIKLFENAPAYVYEDKEIDSGFIKRLCERSLIFLDLEGILVREFILKREMKSTYDNNLDITFLNKVFEKCKGALREFLYQMNNYHSDENMRRVRVLDSLFLENAYDELYEKFIKGKIKTDFYVEYGLEKKQNAPYFLKKEVYYNLYKLFSEDER